MSDKFNEATTVASWARDNPGEQKDLGEKFMMRPAFHAPKEVMDKIRIRFPEVFEDSKAFAKWYNSSASEYYNRFKTRKRL